MTDAVPTHAPAPPAPVTHDESQPEAVPGMEPGPAAPAVSVMEVRVLEGPNLYFTRPAVKVMLDVPGIIDAPARRARRLAGRLGLRSADPGRAGTLERQQFAVRVARQLVRRLTTETGIRNLRIAARAGNRPTEVIVAFPWARRARALALGEAIAPVLADLLDGTDTATAPEADQLVTQAAARIRAVRTTRADAPTTLVPQTPVVAVTGTNGKTTTTRLVAHIAMRAGLRTGWSSTSGVYVDGVEIAQGDYSGPAGGRAVLEAAVDLAVLETARGGMLLKGLGVTHNDVCVVTNVTADHLGLQGVDTVDQLAEVKAIITRVTRPQGWAVLNGDDPRVWAMRAGTLARPWAFSLDPASPALREALAAGGRGLTIIDGKITVLYADGEVDTLVSFVEVPLTLAGLSRHNVANALAATAASLAAGISREDVVAGLESFTPDGEHNPGRMNLYSVPLAPFDGTGSATVILDMAHNEDGLLALTEVARGLTAPGRHFRLGLGTGGDRTDEILRTMGALAGTRADDVAVVHKEHYLRDRSREDLEAHLRAGLAAVGVAEVDSFPDELCGLQGLLTRAGDGDVVAIMTHQDWVQLDAAVRAAGAQPDSARAVRRKVRRARGEHEHEETLRRLASEADPGARRAALLELAESDPGDPRFGFELARVDEAEGHLPEAARRLDDALAAGLGEPHRHQAQLLRAAVLRRDGHPQQALDALDEVAEPFRASAAYAALRALALLDAARAGEAVGELLDALLAASAGADEELFREALHARADELRS